MSLPKEEDNPFSDTYAVEDDQDCHQPEPPVTHTNKIPDRKWITPSMTTNANFLISTRSPRCKALVKGQNWCKAKPPTSFDELVNLVRNHGHFFSWLSMPRIMSFSEFDGYWFKFQTIWTPDGTIDIQYPQHSLEQDESKIRAIIRATIHTGRRPFYAPDHFFHSKNDRCEILQHYFKNRHSISNIIWDVTGSKETRMVKHPDYPKLKEWILNNVPTGEWLFNPDRTNQVHWAREVVELNKLLVCKEAVEICKREGFVLGSPERRVFRTNWSHADRKVIMHAARIIWSRWRNNAEQKLEVIHPRPKYQKS